MKLGVIVSLNNADNIDAKFKTVRDYGFDYCQITAWNFDILTDDVAKKIIEACEKYSIKISTFWCGWTGPRTWNFYEGNLTLGLVPAEYRFQRMKDLTFGSDFAKKLGVDKVATHVGFLPENPTSSQYNELIVAIRYVAAHCKANGQKFLFETGQETPVTLRRAIEDIALDNLGINLDPANLIMYGKGNPVDALDVFGEFVLDVHAKDGLYPTDGKKLGREVKVGEGKVNFPALINGLKKVGYDGVLTIEREISGEQQGIDILDTKKYLENLLNEG